MYLGRRLSALSVALGIFVFHTQDSHVGLPPVQAAIPDDCQNCSGPHHTQPVAPPRAWNSPVVIGALYQPGAPSPSDTSSGQISGRPSSYRAGGQNHRSGLLAGTVSLTGPAFAASDGASSASGSGGSNGSGSGSSGTSGGSSGSGSGGSSSNGSGGNGSNGGGSGSSGSGGNSSGDSGTPNPPGQDGGDPGHPSDGTGGGSNPGTTNSSDPPPPWTPDGTDLPPVTPSDPPSNPSGPSSGPTGNPTGPANNSPSATNVPEPASAPILIAGIIGAVLLGRRRRLQSQN